MPQVKPQIETFAKIKVVGIGGSGSSAVDRMVKNGIRGVDFIVMNTDVQALHHNSAPHKLHIGKTITRGLGAGMDPDVGRRSAEESQNEIREMLKDTDMVFVTCGLGGGTGSGAAPVVASIARELGALTVAVVTKPFTFEGPQRKNIAEQAYDELARHVDTIITIPNDRVLQIIDKRTSLIDAFKIVDDVLRQGVQGISELITVPGLINVDFADVKSVMKDTGSALMGIGIGSGDTRAMEAAQAAISSPLLELSIDGARGILFTITGGSSLGMQEVAEAAKIITSSADDNVRVIFGTVIDESMGEDIRVTVIATGFTEEETHAPAVGEEERKLSFPLRKPFTSSNTSMFTKKKPYIPPPQPPEREPEVEEVEDEEETPPAAFRSKPLGDIYDIKPKPVVPSPQPAAPKPVRPAIPQQAPPAKDKEEDLEIPAFIRKKMGL